MYKANRENWFKQDFFGIKTNKKPFVMEGLFVLEY